MTTRSQPRCSRPQASDHCRSQPGPGPCPSSHPATRAASLQYIHRGSTNAPIVKRGHRNLRHALRPSDSGPRISPAIPTATPRYRASHLYILAAIYTSRETHLFNHQRPNRQERPPEPQARSQTLGLRTTNTSSNAEVSRQPPSAIHPYWQQYLHRERPT